MTFYRLDSMQIVLGLSLLYRRVHCMLELLLRFYSTSLHEGRRLGGIKASQWCTLNVLSLACRSSSLRLPPYTSQRPDRLISPFSKSTHKTKRRQKMTPSAHHVHRGVRRS